MIAVNVESQLRRILQKNIKLRINNKTIREGILILFNIKDFYISLMLKQENGTVKTYELPVPYAVNSHNGDVTFDYALDHISHKRVEFDFLMKSLYSKIGKKSKFYDNSLIIQIQ